MITAVTIIVLWAAAVYVLTENVED